MFEMLYYIFVYPIYLIIEVLYYLFSSSGFPIWLVIFVISYFVNLISSPMYMAADHMQQEERDLQNKMAPRIKSIKANFKGTERYMMLATYYRQNHYHPIMALRKSLSILIQVPFFMAAYLFFSHLELLNGISVGSIKNLGLPDGLLYIGDLRINILPILMTLINIMSAQIYSKNLKVQDKVQMYALPLVFLILLYKSPAGLVLYWTFNQLISLIRNIILKLKNSRNVFYLLNVTFIVGIAIAFVLKQQYVFDVILFWVAIFLLLLPMIYVYINQLDDYRSQPLTSEEKRLFFLTCIANCICMSCLVHSSLFVTDPINFSLSLLFVIFMQSAGLFLVLPYSLYVFTGKVFKRFLLISSVMILFCSITNILHSEQLSLLTNIFIFRRYLVSIAKISANYFICLCVFIVLALLFYKRYIKVLVSCVTIILISCLILSGFNIAKLYKFYNNDELKQINTLTPQIHLSKTGKNVVVFMMDRYISSFLPKIFEEKPELIDIYTGFTYYPNTLSYYGHTILGMPLLLGGYEYIPEILDKRPEKFSDKYLESLTVLPSIFRDNNFDTLMIDIPWSDFKYSINGDLFKKNNIGWKRLSGRYNSLYYDKYPKVINDSIEIQKFNGLMFSVLKSLPLLFKDKFYNGGNYWLIEKNFYIPKDVLDAYPVMYFLPQLTDFSSKKNTFTFIDNLLTHSGVVLEYPSYSLTSKSVINESLLKITPSHEYYHVDMAAMLLIGKFIEYLKDNNVYDNTRIIIVSDHGSRDVYNNEKDDFFNKVTIRFNPVLFVKDFNSTGKYKTDNTFMTIADVPLVALDGIVDNPINPISNNMLTNKSKEDGVVIFADKNRWNTNDFPGSKVFDKNSHFIKVKDNIFDQKNYKLNYKYE